MTAHVQGSTHQSDPKYQGCGRQCTAMAMTALAYHQVSSVTQWKQKDMDYIMDRGDQLYMTSSKLQNVTFLLPSDVVQSIHIGFNTVTVSTQETQSGVLSLDCQKQDELLVALDQVQHSCILTFGHVLSSYALGVIRDEDTVYVFDSHSRDSQGLCVSEGRACVTKHDSMKDVAEFVVNLAWSVGLVSECLFEVVEVEACVKQENEIDDVTMIDGDDIPLINLIGTSNKNLTAEDEDSDFELPLVSVQEKIRALRYQSSVASPATPETMEDGVLEKTEAAGGNDLDSLDDLVTFETKYAETVHNFLIACEVEMTGGNDLSFNISNSSTDFGCSRAESPMPGLQVIRQSRKRKRNMDEWKSNVKKRMRNSGKEYETKSGNVRRQRELQPGCGTACRNKCQLSITPEERSAIFHIFWQMGCLGKQREFLCKAVEKQQKKTTQVMDSNSRRTSTYQYYLQICDKRIKVCKKMFLDTLDISERQVFTAINKMTEIGICDTERRGKHKNRGIPEEKDEIRKHINSFPRVESHYSRKDSKREYLESSLSMQKMYELYVNKRLKEGCKTPASETTYRTVFNQDFNISFHKRMKDRCDTCGAHEQTKSDSEEYKEHLTLKDESRLYKSRIKDRLKEHPCMAAAVFDLEEVLPCPSSGESCLYYKRKLNTYNLTVYDYRNGQGYCYVWSEVDALRGSNEIASCVYRYLCRLKEQGVSEVVLFSDSCGGQNRNKHFLSMLWFAMRQLHFKVIEHVFFVSGHSQNEGDSMHSTIERASRHVPVYTPTQWAQLMRTAKRKKPVYIVEEINGSDVYNFKKISGLLKNFELDSDREKVKWLKVRRFSLLSSEPNIVKVYYDYTDNCRSLNLMQKIRVVHPIPNEQSIKLETVSRKPYPLNKDKYLDLIDLCNNNIIPHFHHEFFKSLPHETDE